jgi:trk system potassium uptake protein TrkH
MVGNNFAHISDSAKWICSIAMLVGRLEIFTFLVLLTPMYWRR